MSTKNKQTSSLTYILAITQHTGKPGNQEEKTPLHAFYTFATSNKDVKYLHLTPLILTLLPFATM